MINGACVCMCVLMFNILSFYLHRAHLRTHMFMYRERPRAHTTHIWLLSSYETGEEERNYELDCVFVVMSHPSSCITSKKPVDCRTVIYKRTRLLSRKHVLFRWSVIFFVCWKCKNMMVRVSERDLNMDMNVIFGVWPKRSKRNVTLIGDGMREVVQKYCQYIYTIYIFIR